MKVGLRVDPVLLKRLKALHFQDQHRIAKEIVALVTEELNNGIRHRIRRFETDVEETLGVAFEKAVNRNRTIRDIVTDRVLRPILAREELRPR